MAPSSVIQNVTQLSLPHTTTHPHTLLSGGTIPSDQAAVRSPGAAPGRWCSAPPPPRPGRRGRRPHGLVDLQPVILRRWVHVNRGVDAVLVVGIVVAVGVGGEGGGGEEAHGIPGGGEEDEDRGQEVQCWADEAHHGWEDKEGGSISGRDRNGVPGADWARRATATARDGGDHTADAPPERVSEGEFCSPLPAPRCRRSSRAAPRTEIISGRVI